MNSKEERLNNLLTLAILVLMIFILICAYYLSSLNDKEMNDTFEVSNTLAINDGVSSVVYLKENFGNTFDFSYLDGSTLLDEYNGYKFLKFDNTYYVIDDTNTYSCNYLYDEINNEYNYRFCLVNNEVKIDFSNMKFVRNND